MVPHPLIWTGGGASSILRSVPLPQPSLGRAPQPPSAPSSLPPLSCPTPGSLGPAPASAPRPSAAPPASPGGSLAHHPPQPLPAGSLRLRLPPGGEPGRRALWAAAGSIAPPPLRPGQCLASKQNCWVNCGKLLKRMKGMRQGAAGVQFVL